MLYLVRYSKRINGNVCEVKQGLIWGGVPRYVLEKAFAILKLPVKFCEENVINEHLYVQKEFVPVKWAEWVSPARNVAAQINHDNTTIEHIIQASSPDTFITTYPSIET